MKRPLVIITLMLIAVTNSIAQKESIATMRLRYKIELTNTDSVTFKGWLMNLKENDLSIYTASRQDLKNKTPYTLTQFDYTNIQQLQLKKRNSGLKGILVGGSIGAVIFAGSFLLPNKGCGCKQLPPEVFAFSGIPLGVITGFIIGGVHKKKFKINGNKNLFNEFKNKIK